MRRTSRDIRVANRFEVLRQIIGAGATSRQQITAATGLSAATVSTLVAQLLELGLLTEVGFQDSGGGRPRGLVAVNPVGGILVGVDVAETYVHAEAFDPALTVLATAEARLNPVENRPEQVIGHIVAGIRSALDAARQPPRPLLGVGVSVPGLLDPAGGVSIFAPNWNWHDVPLRSMLDAVLGMPFYLDSPLRASVVAELWFGAGRGHDDIAVLTLGTGVGAGLAFGGSLYRGASNTAGEWGHTRLVLDGRECRCGARGCVEAYVGAPGIMAQLRMQDPASPMLHPDDQTATIEALAAGVESGDPIARAVVAETARYLGVAVADLVNLVNPEVVVLTSWVAARLGPALLGAVRAEAGRYALRRPLAATEIVLGRISGNTVSLGAATLALAGVLAGVGTPAGAGGASGDHR
ncbi:transcriptional regulator [Micromonospora endophytica]|uniref:Transcriptional regulator n=1 Tax=Micromonospora endophytica TaxID=515350 RepID=A0A2W2CFD7_9ACTN|nr:transcriptional regulator [Micromonospora endophytica]RIW51426.1 ROK family transcriptional regulator [Micromonospora endophytica]BCJ62141.1 sugar kinase [Micromonospora endophytica]